MHPLPSVFPAGPQPRAPDQSSSPDLQHMQRISEDIRDRMSEDMPEIFA